MNKFAWFIFFVFLATFAHAAETISRSELLAAAQKLADVGNYTWQATSIVTGGISCTETGCCQADGSCSLTCINDTLHETNYAVRCGRTVVKFNDVWLFPLDLPSDKTNMILTLTASALAGTLEESYRPASGIQKLIQINGSNFVRLDDGSYGCEIPPHPDSWSPSNCDEWLAPSDQKVGLKIWTENGRLKKYELKITNLRKLSEYFFNPPIECTFTVEIKNVGTTKVVIPPDAAKKLFE